MSNGKYGSQLILTFNADAVVKVAAEDLEEKDTSIPNCVGHLRLPPASRLEMRLLKHITSKLKAPIRLYLVAHGDWQSQKLGSWTADHVAALIKALGLPTIKTVSVVACELGRDLQSTDYVRIGQSADSFASKLHALLKSVCGIETMLHARLLTTKVHEGGSKWVRPRVDLSESSELKGAEQHHMKFSKITFYWDTNKKQRRKWSYIGADVSYEDDAKEIFLDSLRKLSTAAVVRYN